MSHSTLHHLGIAFDIDGLDDFMYGFAAYRLLFRSVIAEDRQLLFGCRFWDGDTKETLAGNARDYVIAVGTIDPDGLGELRRVLASVEAPGLKAPDSRFLKSEDLYDEPLVYAACVNPLGVMEQCDTSWVLTAWQVESSAVQAPSGLAASGDSTAQRRPG
ncbi:MAG: hypothetical protein Q8S09_09790 [Hyphomonas sp.]|jgi:hypothetical protein|nr:hypothetical protein [Hyphomonas sp.]